MGAFSPTGIRCVTHKDVDSEDIDRAIEAVREIVRGWGR
jgi:threonine aldolase